jgi:ribonuclease PH
MIKRSDGRNSFDIRNLKLTRACLPYPEGSCMVELGNTRIIATASIENGVPPWLAGSEKGWITAEYGMLPRSTQKRNKRQASAVQQNGRTMEIQRLIGRSMRAVSDTGAIGERTVFIDCDVISADGGTRTASIVGASVALYDAGRCLVEKGLVKEHPMKKLVSATSVGIVGGEIAVDLCYEEDSSADVDMNVVMSEDFKIIEIQGTAEKKPFGRELFLSMIDAAESAIKKIIKIQNETLGL